MSNDELFKYFTDQTNQRLDRIELSLSDLKQFKVEMLASARTTALIVSIFCGFITLLTTAVTVYFTVRPHG